jgi:hypothetical protein
MAHTFIAIVIAMWRKIEVITSTRDMPSPRKAQASLTWAM